jgi:hypothetical protein
METLALEKALNTIKTLASIAAVLNFGIVALCLINYIQKGKFNDNIHS